MKKARSASLMPFGFLAVGFIFVDLIYRLFFIHIAWSEEPYFLVGAWMLLLIYLVLLTRTTARLRKTEADLRRSEEELQRRVNERSTQLEKTMQKLLAEMGERQRNEERQRLARELHDSVAQTLYGISLGINTASSFLDTDRTQTVEALDYALRLTDAGILEMRALIFELRPDGLEAEGLVIALTKRIAALAARYSIEVALDLCDEPGISSQAKDALYRIAQEALQNVVRHAQARRLDVRLSCETDWIVLEVCDNGTGFDPMAAHPGHLGLKSMRERAEALKGTLEIVSATACGTQIRARLPLESAAAT